MNENTCEACESEAVDQWSRYCEACAKDIYDIVKDTDDTTVSEACAYWYDMQVKDTLYTLQEYISK